MATLRGDRPDLVPGTGPQSWAPVGESGLGLRLGVLAATRLGSPDRTPGLPPRLRAEPDACCSGLRSPSRGNTHDTVTEQVRVRQMSDAQVFLVSFHLYQCLETPKSYQFTCFFISI